MLFCLYKCSLRVIAQLNVVCEACSVCFWTMTAMLNAWHLGSISNAHGQLYHMLVFIKHMPSLAALSV